MEGTKFLETLQKKVEKLWGKKFSIPQRYKDFILNEEWKKYEKKSATVKVDGEFDFGAGEEILWITDSEKLEDMFQHDFYDAWDEFNNDRYIPIAEVGSVSAFLVLDISKPQCPVGFFNPDGNDDDWYEILKPSLDEFLATMYDYDEDYDPDKEEENNDDGE